MRLGALLAGLVWLAAAGAEPAGEVHLELNKLETQGEGCRVYLLFENGLPERLRSLKLDLVVFDPDGVIARRVAVDAGALTAGKTVLKVFDLAELPCGEIGRMLLNDVPECAGEAGARSDCVEVVRTSSRSDVELIK